MSSALTVSFQVDLENPADLVEIKADLIADIACSDSRQERIDFLLSTDLDELSCRLLDLFARS